MPLTPPSPADLKARYPEFVPVADPTAKAALDATPEDVSEAWPMELQRPAMLALGAHWLVQTGALNPASSESAIGNGAPVASLRAGDHEIRFAASASSGALSSPSTGADDLARSSYGRRFLELRARAFPPFVAVV